MCVGAEPGAEAGTQIAGITTPDKRTVVFKLSRPTGGTLAAALVLPLTAPVPRDYALPLDREKVSEYGTKQVATGPYMVGAYEPGTRIELVRNPSWDAKTDFRPAYLDKISMPQGNEDADDDVAAHAQRQGHGHRRLPAAAGRAQGGRHEASRTSSKLVDSGGGRWAALNTKVAPFDDVNVRKAVLAGFDRQATLLALGGEKVGTVATHFLPPGMPGFEQAGGVDGTGADYLAAPGGDAAVAASYLKKAGYASGRYEGEPILMVGPMDGNGRNISELAKASFEKLGFEVKLRLLSQQIVQTKYCGCAGLDRRGLPERRLGARLRRRSDLPGPDVQRREHPAGRQRERLPARRPGGQRGDRERLDADRSGGAGGRLGRGRPRDRRRGARRPAGVGQGLDGALRGRQRGAQREPRRLGLRLHFVEIDTRFVTTLRAPRGADRGAR